MRELAFVLGSLSVAGALLACSAGSDHPAPGGYDGSFSSLGDAATRPDAEASTDADADADAD